MNVCEIKPGTQGNPADIFSQVATRASDEFVGEVPPDGGSPVRSSGACALVCVVQSWHRAPSRLSTHVEHLGREVEVASGMQFEFGLTYRSGFGSKDGLCEGLGRVRNEDGKSFDAGHVLQNSHVV